jgi:phosphomannomutase
LNLIPLNFGTDGWRGVIAREATFETIRRLARAAASRYRAGDFGPGDRSRILVGHDTRFLSEEFAAAASEVFAGAGIDVVLTDRPIPTPAVSHHVRRLGLAGGVAVTASHNPAEYNGFKLKAHFGGSAPPGLYRRVEEEIDRPCPGSRRAGRIRKENLSGPYRAALGRLVDRARIRRAGLRLLADAMHGAAGDGLAEILRGGATRVESFRADRDALFGHGHPEPIARNLTETARRVQDGEFDFAAATDGDGDRLGVLDARGGFVSPHRILALLVLHAFRVRGLSGGIARTFSTSLLIDRIAEKLRAPVFETGIGFKYVAELMISGKAAVGGEESGGYGFSFHLPERDGTLSALLLAEHLAATRRSLSEALDALDREFGRLEYARRDILLPSDEAAAFLEETRRRPPRAIAGRRVTGVRVRDGVKLLFGGQGWLLLRLSGTEPMIRLYCEHADPAAPEEILSRAEERLRRRAEERT